MSNKRVIESRLEQVQKIIDVNPEAKEKFVNIYKESNIPLWLRTTMSTFIEKNSWTDVESPQRLLEGFSHEAVIRSDQDKCRAVLELIRDKYSGCPGEFIHNMNACITVEKYIISSYSLDHCGIEEAISVISGLVKTEDQKTHTTSADIAEKAYHTLVAECFVDENMNPQRKKQRTMEPESSNVSKMTYVKDLEKACALFKEEVDACLEAVYNWKKEDNSTYYRGEDIGRQFSLDDIEQQFLAMHNNFIKMQDVYTKAKASEGDVPQADDVFSDIRKWHQHLEERSFVVSKGVTGRIFNIDKKKHDPFQLGIRNLLGKEIDTKVTLSLCSRGGSQKADFKWKPVSRDAECSKSVVILENVNMTNFKRFKSPNGASVMSFLKIDVVACMCDQEKNTFELRHGPFMFASHSQMARDEGLLLWNLAFPLKENVEDCHSEVDWEDFIAVLSSYWSKETEGCELSKVNLECLADYFGNANGTASNTFKISHRRVFEEKVNSSEADKKKQFTLWEWFIGCINLANEFPILFKEGLIHGFVTKNRTKELLDHNNEGTFLIRFSQTFLDKGTNSYAGLSVTVRHKNSKNGKYQILYGDQFSLNHPGGAEGVLPREKSFGRWLMDFAALSYEDTYVYLTHLVGKTELVGKTFGGFTERHNKKKKDSDYVSFKNVKVFDMNSGQASCISPPVQEYQKFVTLCDQVSAEFVSSDKKDKPYAIVLMSPTSQRDHWTIGSYIQEENVRADEAGSNATSLCNQTNSHSTGCSFRAAGKETASNETCIGLSGSESVTAASHCDRTDLLNDIPVAFGIYEPDMVVDDQDRNVSGAVFPSKVVIGNAMNTENIHHWLGFTSTETFVNNFRFDEDEMPSGIVPQRHSFSSTESSPQSTSQYQNRKSRPTRSPNNQTVPSFSDQRELSPESITQASPKQPKSQGLIEDNSPMSSLPASLESMRMDI